MMDLSRIADRSSSDDGRVAGYLFLVLFIASAIAALAVAGISREYNSYDVFPLLALPFAVMGILSYVDKRRWIILVVSAVICVVLYIVSAPWGYIALLTLFCARGVSSTSALLQRRLFSSVISMTERSTVRPKRRSLDRLALFLFGIPKNIDTRVMGMRSSIRRDGIPWDELTGTLRIALVPALVMWIVLFTLLVYHYNSSQAYVAVFVVCIYIAALSLPWLALKTLDVRVGTEGGGMRLYDGMVGTATRMSVPLVLVLIFVAVVLYTGYETVLYILISAVVSVVFIGVAMAMYYIDYEGEVVSEISDARAGFLPENDGAPEIHRIDDGVPGTPRRSEDSCFDQRNRSLNAGFALPGASSP